MKHRKYTDEPRGPLEVVVMALGHELFVRENPGEDWFGLVGSSVGGYCRRACEKRGISWPWIRRSIQLESIGDQTERM